MTGEYEMVTVSGEMEAMIGRSSVACVYRRFERSCVPEDRLLLNLLLSLCYRIYDDYAWTERISAWPNSMSEHEIGSKHDRRTDDNPAATRIVADLVCYMPVRWLERP
jgi:hypothetical protein